jgi:hypothetical protein
MLEKEFKYYIDNQNELVKVYNGKYLLIKGQKVIEAFNDQASAYIEGTKNYELGTFLIQYCSPGKDNYTQTFHSRVRFA